MRSAPPPRPLVFWPVVLALTILAAAPFWVTRILPMQDYPQILLFARAYGDCKDPASPFHGTYTTGFPLSPLVLPILLLRVLGAPFGLEAAGRVMWTLYAVGLPLASIHLLAVLGRDRWAVLLVYPILMSYWVIGGFFAFATAAPILVLGLALAVRWLMQPSLRRGAAFAAALCALHLWHSLAFAQILLDFGVLWLLFRFERVRDRLRALLPLAPALALFALWMGFTIVAHAPGSRPPVWPPLADAVHLFFDPIGPSVPGATAAAGGLALVLLAGGLARSPDPGRGPFRVQRPFALLALLAVISYLALPGMCFGVEGINNRQPWLAALLLVFGWSLPSRASARAALLAVVAGAGVFVLAHFVRSFAVFGRETAGASRLIDRLGPGDTLLAPARGGVAVSFPGKPLVALDLYASIRRGGLPNTSFAGYDVNLVRYVGGRNPMPGLLLNWVGSPALTRFDYVLLHAASPEAAAHPDLIQHVATDGQWALYAVCGSRAHPRCP